MAAFAIIFCAFVILLIIYFYKNSKLRHENFPPGPPRLPIWGSYWFLLKENYYFTHRSAETLGKRYNTNLLGFYLGPQPVIVTLDYNLSKEVLVRQDFDGRPDILLTRDRSGGELLGIFFVEGPYWKEQRRFSLRQLRDYGFGRRFVSTELHFEKEMRDLIELLSSDPGPSDKEVCRKRGQVLAPDIFYVPLMNSILNMLIGSRQIDNRKLREVSRAIRKFLSSADAVGGAVSATPWLKNIAPNFFGYSGVVESNRVMMAFIKEHVLERRKDFSDDYHADFTDKFLSKMEELERENEINPTFTEKQLIWVLVDYMFPAPVAVGLTLQYIFANLFNSPEVQTKIQEEIDRVVGRSRLPNLDDRRNMPYTEAVIRETIRKNPITPLGVPKKAVTDTTLGGYSIPKDTFVLVSIHAAHHDPKVWDEPEKFKPERFLDVQGNLLKKDLTIGFGAGKRLCAGETFARQSLFLILAGLLQNFTFKPVGQVPDLKKNTWGLLLQIDPTWMEAVSR